MVDLLRHCGCFTLEEATEFVDNGALNGLFVLGRSLGFIGTSSQFCTVSSQRITVLFVVSGHFLDQKRLRQGLYRHPWDDISYILPESM